ncbi:hypothetical protein PENPOL_c012G03791 [Penicillium polonicum]|uniref:F-box domain-containing protein n=1 Tax=Penicillium polonicum TaxID=60169 RepID=A0A1V6NDC0_PENPO|nr:hypothetical protein PENPOL_c012G03791 [Penicillium polonicum]
MTLNSRLRLALRRKEKTPISHEPKTSKLHNGGIPAEILDLVYEQLPALEQIYLALTCKYLYTHFVSFLKVKALDHAKLLIPSEERLPLPHNAELEAKPRIQLLRHLENERWKCCVVCMKLHQLSAFEPPRQFKKEPAGHKCGFHDRDCMPFAGLVDICPCLSITFNERHLLANAAMYCSVGGIFPEDFKPKGMARFSHNCHVTSHLDAQVTIETLLIPETTVKNPSGLIVRNIYTFEFSNGLPGALSGICPRKQTNKWLKRFFTETGLDYSAWGGSTRPLVTEPHLIKISTQRDLGASNWNKRGWKENRNDRG